MTKKIQGNTSMLEKSVNNDLMLQYVEELGMLAFGDFGHYTERVS